MKLVSQPIAGLFLLTLASCQTSSVAHQSPHVFADPGSYLGQQVTVCGRLSGTANIHEERGDRGLSISLAGDGLQPNLASLSQHAHVCLTGEVTYLGCQSDTGIICTDWAFDYALEVVGIRELR